jgi:hypothetical protein
MVRRAFALLVLGMTTFVVHARAQTVTTPLWASGPNPERDAPARDRFQAALAARGLGAAEAFALPADAAAVEDGVPGAGSLSPAALALDREAALRARAKGAAFALLGRLHLRTIEQAKEPAQDEPLKEAPSQIDLRLVDARTGLLKDSTAVSIGAQAEPGDLAAAVLRLDEVAGRADLAMRAHLDQGTPGASFPVVPPPARSHAADGPAFTTDRRGWLRAHWPLLTALGTAVGTSLALGILVARDSTPAHP